MDYIEFRRQYDEMRKAIVWLEDVMLRLQIEYAEEHCPIKKGTIVKDHWNRILVDQIRPAGRDHWTLKGTVLKKNLEPAIDRYANIRRGYVSMKHDMSNVKIINRE